MDQHNPQSTSSSSPPLEITCSSRFVQWLSEQQISLAFTTYQTNRLFLIGLKPDGQLSVFERLFDHPMGLYATSDRLYMSSRYQLWQFDNALPPGELYNGYDKLYVPRLGYTTGELDVHDIAMDKAEQVVFVNTLYSCLATLSHRHSFTPLWHPPFISRLAPEDRCHLNGLAMVEGEPRYVTAVSRSDVAAGWRERWQDGGCVIDVQANQIILASLSMPHSPRFYNGKLWLLNSGSGEFGYVDLERGSFEPTTFCPGYLRGLAFHNNLAIVGLSKPRENRTFSGLPLDEQLQAKDAEPRCGLMVIDLNNGHIAHWLHLEGVVTELYDVQVLPGVRRPMALGFKTDEIQKIITIDQSPSVILHTLSATTAPPAKTKDTPYQFQLSLDMTVAAVIADYEALTFPNIRQKAQRRTLQEPLVAVTASHHGQLIGLALAEIRPDGASAEVLSLFVVPEHRGQSVGSSLLAYLEKALVRKGCAYIDLVYQANWSNVAAIERLVQKQDWAPPQTRMLLCKSNAERISKAPWLDRYTLPDEFTIFPWAELTAQERQTIEQRQQIEPWYPPVLTPFQEEDRLEPFNSLGLRYQGQVVGWMITHRVAPDTVQYTSLFIQQEFQQLGRAVALIAEAIKRQIDGGVPYGIFMIDVENKAMVKFFRRRLQPYMTSLTEARCSRKNLCVD